MANRLKMDTVQKILALKRLGWSDRRIARALGVHRESVARHVRLQAGRTADDVTDLAATHPPDEEQYRPNLPSGFMAMKAFEANPPPGSAAATEVECNPPVGTTIQNRPNPPAGSALPPSNLPTGSSAAEPVSNLPAGSAHPSSDSPTGSVWVPEGNPPMPAGSGPPSQCEAVHDVIVAGMERGLSAQRIWQDLRSEHGFAGSYDSVKRFCRRLRHRTPLPFRRMESPPGEEAQVDFGTGAPIVIPEGVPLPVGVKSRRRKTHVLRVVLSCSRKGYSEVVLRQTAEDFLRALENAFHHFGGVPKTIVIDNLKAGVLKADWFDPELNPKLAAFAEHYGTVILPTRPRMPRHKGKVERGVGYVQDNALKGRTFTSLAEQNEFLACWESDTADTRIHGTTRKQVRKLFEEVEKAALLPLPTERFPQFQEARRVVNRDGHVEVAKSYYSVPPEYLGRTVWARWDARIVRIFDRDLRQIAIHVRRDPGCFSTAPDHIAARKRGGIEQGAAWWLRKARWIGRDAGCWAESVIQQRGVHGIRLIMGLVSLTHRHRDAEINDACRTAQAHGAHRLRDIRNLLKRAEPAPEQLEFIDRHPLIRSLDDYGKLVQRAFTENHA